MLCGAPDAVGSRCGAPGPTAAFVVGRDGAGGTDLLVTPGRVGRDSVPVPAATNAACPSRRTTSSPGRRSFRSRSRRLLARPTSCGAWRWGLWPAVVLVLLAAWLAVRTDWSAAGEAALPRSTTPSTPTSTRSSPRSLPRKTSSSRLADAVSGRRSARSCHPRRRRTRLSGRGPRQGPETETPGHADGRDRDRGAPQGVPPQGRPDRRGRRPRPGRARGRRVRLPRAERLGQDHDDPMRPRTRPRRRRDRCGCSGAPSPADWPRSSARSARSSRRPALFPTMSGRDEPRAARPRSTGIGARRVEAVLEQVGLGERAGDAVRNYSLGMRQRLALAAALLKDPALLILDEPANGLDPAGMRSVRELLARLGRRGSDGLRVEPPALARSSRPATASRSSPGSVRHPRHGRRGERGRGARRRAPGRGDRSRRCGGGARRRRHRGRDRRRAPAGRGGTRRSGPRQPAPRGARALDHGAPARGTQPRGGLPRDDRRAGP